MPARTCFRRQCSGRINVFHGLADKARLAEAHEQTSMAERFLHALAARAPFFHDGSAASLADVIAFYEARFQIGFTDGEKADLLAFLNSL